MAAREEVGGGMDVIGDGDEDVQTSIYKIHVAWGWKVQHRECSQ